MENVSTRDEIHTVIGKEKEHLRTTGKDDVGKKDIFAGSKLKVVDAVIEQIDNVEAILNANKLVKQQIEKIPSKTEVSGDAAIAHFIKNELSSLTAMKNALVKAYSRDPSKMTVQEQLDSLRSENNDFKKALKAEKESQIAAFSIRSDKETWKQISTDPVLAQLIDQKAKQKPSGVLGQYQLLASSMDKNSAAVLLNEVSEIHKYLVKNFSKNPETTKAMKKKDARSFDAMKKYADSLETSQKTSPLNLKNFNIKWEKPVLNSLMIKNGR